MVYKKLSYTGFSLVELSVVLVLLGLLTGGILTGKSLIRASELRAITTETQAFAAATTLFSEKYFALPGDMNNATSYWGTNTANGDNDVIIENGAVASTASEMFMFWNQLGLAGLITGQYTGIAGSSSIWAGTYDVNIPASKVKGTGYIIMTADYTGGDGWLFAYNYTNTIVYGSGGNNDWPGGPALTPEEAWNIDKKMDDGHPARGNVHAMNWQWGCVVATSGALASNNFNVAYNLSLSEKQCAFVFQNLF
jgi:prepilin-type N-terminal cleavage/methylation domain-containing protein